MGNIAVIDELIDIDPLISFGLSVQLMKVG